MPPCTWPLVANACVGGASETPKLAPALAGMATPSHPGRSPGSRHSGPTPMRPPNHAHLLADSVHFLSKPRNFIPIPNAHRPSRPAPPSVSVTAAPARGAHRAICTRSHVAVSTHPARWIGKTPVDPPWPRPSRPPPVAPAICLPGTRPGAAVHPRQAPPRCTPKNRPVAPQEFFGKNSHRARGAHFTPPGSLPCCAGERAVPHRSPDHRPALAVGWSGCPLPSAVR